MQMRYKAALLTIIGALALYGCGQDEATSSASGDASSDDVITVVIGHVAPLTGNIAHLGKDNENGARLAVDDLNAQQLKIGGKTLVIQLQGEDDQADPKTATLVAQKLVDSRVAGVVGHLNSGTTIPASQIYADAGIPQVSPSATNPTYTLQGFKTAFRVMANDIQQGSVLGRYAVKGLGAKRMAIIDDRTAYGQGLADEVEKGAKAAGAEIVAREFTRNDATDFRAILTSIKSRNPDVIFYGGMDAQAGPMAKQMRQLGMDAKFMAGDGGCSPEFIKLAGDAAEGTYCSQTGLPLEKMPRGPAFAKRYMEKFGSPVQIYSPYSYDAVQVLVDAMVRAGSIDPAKYLPEIARTSFEGVSGRVEFDEKGDLRNGAVTVYVVRNGKHEVREIVGGSPIDQAAAAVRANIDAAKLAGDSAARAVGEKVRTVTPQP
ncbi:MAG TPA: branched-chain amino acid ABC transporter substrate-binding protein [Burkholderiales bacterium]|nr:branched-chain amino acid ABC transporter substrate-binding protein [Burkholderiales bacterium]